MDRKPPRPASAPKSAKKSAGKRRGRRGKRVGRADAAHATKPSADGLSSHSTSRGAMVDTRAWLLKHYGPWCAYCGLKFNPRVLTLDHVAPRKGQQAYDRRDNLVLACRPCNEKKRDQSPLAFLLAVRSRAANLVTYGEHLSHGLLELVTPLVQRVRYNAGNEDDESPYSDD